jgi:hypothetical protein
MDDLIRILGASGKKFSEPLCFPIPQCFSSNLQHRVYPFPSLFTMTLSLSA